MDPWEQIRKAATDRRSGSVAITSRAAKGVRGLRTRKDLMRAARTLLGGQPAMASLWRMLSDALSAVEQDRVALAVDTYVDKLTAGSEAATDLRWVLGRRARAIMTHSASGTVQAALVASKDRIGSVLCTTSLPGGEGRALARRLSSAGLDARVIADAEIARVCSTVDMAIVGADAVTEQAVVNKVGTALVALAAREAGVPCYAIAPTGKLLPHSLATTLPAAFEHTPLGLFDAVLTEQGPKRAAAVRKMVARVRIAPALEGLRL